MVIYNYIIEQINAFSYLDFRISYQNEKDITVKVSEFLQLTGLISGNLKSTQVQKHTRPKTYNTLSLPTPLYGCETCAIREQDKFRITSAGKKWIRRVAKCTWQDYRNNEDVLSELKISPVLEKIQNYRNKWMEHIRRKDRDRQTDCHT
jgi:hypothetical protein